MHSRFRSAVSCDEALISDFEAREARRLAASQSKQGKKRKGSSFMRF